uniref:Uncharacterized protein n=1 Tax=Lactuca sativa TaxID=4236 RepID=A0A9R1VXF1_LACSA|nr:hypothetical protein LSAT_V11C300147220 [Lactuca sativa]
MEACIKSNYPCVPLEEAQGSLLLLHCNNPSSHLFCSYVFFVGNIDIVSKFIDLESLSGVIKEEWRQVRHTFKKISTNLVYSEAHIS